VLVGACGGGSGDDATDRPAASSTTGPDPLTALEEPDAGEGVAVIGSDHLPFTVVVCQTGPAEGDTPEATLELRITGQGEVDGEVFTIEITRFRSDTGVGVPVVTESASVTVGVGDEVRGLVARRSTAGPEGEWLDLTDPEADGPLIDQVGDAVDVRGNFGIDGATAADAVQSGRVRARCPG